MSNKTDNKEISGFNKECIYFDNSATTFLHTSVIEAYQEMHIKFPGSSGRGTYDLANQAELILSESRNNIKKFFNVDEESELIFCTGSTAAVNMTAFGLRKFIKPGDIILISELEHNSNVLPWRRLAEDTGAFLEFITWKDNGLDYKVLDYISDRNVAVVAITGMSNVIGYKPDLEKILHFAKNVGALTFLDIAQIPGHYKFDFHGSGFDFAAVSAHKMYGPKGIGALIGKQCSLEKLEPMNLGGGGIYSIENKKVTYHTLPNCHEAGTVNVPSIKAWSVACNFLSDPDTSEWLLKEKKIAAYIRNNLKKINLVNVIDPNSYDDNPIIAFECHNIHSHDLSDYLNKKNIAIRTGHLCAHIFLKALDRFSINRISVGLYNTQKEADYLLEQIDYISSY